MLNCRLMMPCSALALMLTVPPSPVMAKVPGQIHCYNAICHRVLTLGETRAAVGKVLKVNASYYDAPARDPGNPTLDTSSGERFRPERADNAASPVYPNGTQLLVWNKASGIAALIRVNNAGPYHPRRKLDVSKALADRLGFASKGVAELHVMVVEAPSRTEATYLRGRRYAVVPGVIGRFSDIEQASLATVATGSGAAQPAAKADQAEIAATEAEVKTLAALAPRRTDKDARPRAATRATAAATAANGKRTAARTPPAKAARGETVADATVPATERTAWTGRFFDR